jgi:DNA phosphorothioation-dependent restriction protein DptG
VFCASEVHRRMVLLKLEYVTVNNEVRWLPFLKHIFQRDKSHLPGPRCYNLQRVLF